MDSEDNMHDDGNVDSLDEDDYYSNDAADDDDDDDSGGDGDDDSCGDGDDDSGGDGDDDVFELDNYTDQPKYFTILEEKDLRQRQLDDITRISSVLSVSRGSAALLLLRYNWNISRVYEEWFADEDRVRKAVGLLEKTVVIAESRNARKDNMIACGICFDSYRRDNIVTAACAHPFCCDCWTAYISTAINSGPGCLTLKCPALACGVVVGIDMVNMLASDENKDKYNRYLLRSYVEDNAAIKWCPAPGCELAIEYDVGSGGSYDVSCGCSYSFCWNCTEDAHRPVDCDTVSKWILKNNDESENTSWILANSKPCPKCKRAIEKNQGCNHMTCREPCKFQFCWICGAEWAGHRACNRYDGAVDLEREKAKKYIQRYTHHYERWASNESSRKKALADLHEMQTVSLKKLSDKLHQPEIKLEFITEGWLQIVECRRVLKWTYAYGYYLPEEEYAKRQFFEYLQGEAEAGLERLHHCAEKELMVYMVDDTSIDDDDFINFRTKLAGLTSVTRNYFENLVRALENGLSEVKSRIVLSNDNNISPRKAAAGTSKRKGRK